ncbi:MAG TPA: clostripain-related cysteine peptidase, partial [Caldilineaceae bacterium]|nr:clostripain-related cysteine peptidase [Caldilineaceae bacterium]
MRYDTEVLSDYVFVGASVDGENFYGEFWTGDSGGFQSFDLDLSEFIGYPQVYIAFYFHSDDVDTDNEGVWLDDVSVWTYVDNGPAQGNEAVQNGDFETGDLSQWTTLPDSATTVAEVENPVEGQHVAQFGGAPDSGEMLSQPLALPDVETQEATLAFWVNLFGEESNDDADYFCAGIYDADLNNLLVDLGCLNGVEALSANFDSANWWENKLTLDAEQWNAVRGRTVNLAFEMFTNDELNSTVYLDDVTFTVVTGGLPGDQYEPNDTGEQATPAQLATPLKELSIHSAQDVDYFKVTVEEAGLLVVNVDAANLGSPLDAVAAVSDANGATLCENDDDGQTTDPYVTCEVAAGDYFVRVTSFSGEGDRNYTYSIQFDLASSGNPPPTPTPPPPTPEPPPSTNPKRAWTAILYIDGDNNLCDSYPGLITRMENELGSRIGPNGFLYITVLIDLDKDYCNGQDGSTRLLVQPNGQYTDNVNRWNLGEVNMGDGQTLVNFATWAMQNYPADHYYLAIDDHGGGVSGISWDDTSNGDNIENNELYAALKQITNNGERKLDVFAYEACLMAMYENVYDLRQFTKYIFGFPTISFTNNASYPSYLGDQRFSANSDGRALGEIMFDVYYQAVQNAYVVSLVDSSKLDALHTAVTGLSAALRPQLNASAAKMAGARSAAQKIDANADNRLSDEDAYIDLWDLANKLAGQGLATTEVAALKQALEAAVIRVDHHPASANTPVDYANAHGLSIYWPLTPSGAYSNYVGNVIYNSTRDGQWDEFLKEFFTVLPNGRGRGGLGAEIGAIE